MTERLSNTSLTTILVHIKRHFPDFLKLPRYKQMHLAERTIAVLVKTCTTHNYWIDIIPLL